MSNNRGSIVPTNAFASEFDYPQEVTITYDMNKLYEVNGKFSDGSILSEVTTTLYAEYDGKKQTVFCIEPGVKIPTEVTPGYEKILTIYARKSKIGFRSLEIRRD